MNEKPSSELIAQWKKAYGEVFSVDTPRGFYVFRSLSYQEFVGITKHASDWSVADEEDEVVITALLYPEGSNLDNIPAGLVSSLAEEILRVSGLGDPSYVREVMERKRQEVNQFRYLMNSFILAMIPAYSEEQLNAMSFSDLAHKIAMAEKIIEIQQAVMSGSEVTLNIVDPEEEAQKQELDRQRHALAKKPGTASYDDPIARKLHAGLSG